jgi:hypothetical protein
VARRLSGHGSLHIKGLTRIISESTTQTRIRPLTQTTFNTQPSKMTESTVNYASMASEIASDVPLHLQGGSKATTVQRQISSFATDMSSKYTNNPSYTPSEEERTALSNLRDALLAGQRAARGPVSVPRVPAPPRRMRTACTARRSTTRCTSFTTQDR